MKTTILSLMALLLFVGTTRADEHVTESHTIVVDGDTIYWNQDSKFDSKQIKERMKRAEEGGPKHFKFSELDQKYYLPASRQFFVPYLEGINLDLSERDEDDS